MTTYLNTKTQYGTETVDQVSREDFNSLREMKREISRLIVEYRIAGIPVYTSRRADKSWNQ